LFFAITPNSGGSKYFPHKCGGFLELTQNFTLIPSGGSTIYYKGFYEMRELHLGVPDISRKDLSKRYNKAIKSLSFTTVEPELETWAAAVVHGSGNGTTCRCVDAKRGS
jgi:hypothetical protein